MPRCSSHATTTCLSRNTRSCGASRRPSGSRNCQRSRRWKLKSGCARTASGIGAQAHDVESEPLATLQANLKKLAALDVPIYISEDDIDEWEDSAAGGDSRAVPAVLGIAGGCRHHLLGLRRRSNLEITRRPDSRRCPAARTHLAYGVPASAVDRYAVAARPRPG
mgnify:CR=1 FL=1